MSSRLSLRGPIGNKMVRTAGCDASQDSAPARGASDGHNP